MPSRLLISSTEHLRIAENRRPPPHSLGNLRVQFVSRWSMHKQVGRGWDVVAGVPRDDIGAQLVQVLQSSRGGNEVRTRDIAPHLQQQLRKRLHARTARADQMDSGVRFSQERQGRCGIVEVHSRCQQRLAAKLSRSLNSRL